MSEQFIMFMIAQLATAGGVYAAIRADLQELRFRMGALESRFEKIKI